MVIPNYALKKVIQNAEKVSEPDTNVPRQSQVLQNTLVAKIGEHNELQRSSKSAS